MKRKLSLMLTASLLLVAAEAPQEAAKKDLDRFQGTWAVQSLENDGKALPPESIKGGQFVVKDNHYTLKGGEVNFQGTLKLDPSQKPPAIDATFVDDQGQEKGKAAGIYELNGDQLKICWQDQSGQRPKAFASKSGSGARLIILKRQK